MRRPAASRLGPPHGTAGWGSREHLPIIGWAGLRSLLQHEESLQGEKHWWKRARAESRMHGQITGSRTNSVHSPAVAEQATCSNGRFAAARMFPPTELKLRREQTHLPQNFSHNCDILRRPPCSIGYKASLGLRSLRREYKTLLNLAS